MKDYVPMESISSAFVDLGWRVLAFFTCFFLGLIEGAIASLISQFLNSSTSSSKSQAYSEIWYEDINTQLFDFPRLSLISVGIIGCALACYGMVKMINGSSKLSVRLMVILGSSLFVILSFQQLGWELGIMIWIILGAFMILNILVLKVWRKQETKKWKAELDLIKEENIERRRQSKYQ